MDVGAPASPAPTGVSGAPAAIPATCMPWKECTGSKGLPAWGQPALRGANARATITLGLVYATIAFREPRRHGEPGGVEERMPLIDPVVDDRDLHPLSRVLERGPHRAGAPMRAGVTCCRCGPRPLAAPGLFPLVQRPGSGRSGRPARPREPLRASAAPSPAARPRARRGRSGTASGSRRPGIRLRIRRETVSCARSTAARAARAERPAGSA